MKAIVLTRYGPPEAALQLREIDRPEPKPGEVLVKVHATSVNDWDWCLARGKPHIYRLIFGLTRPKVTVLGAEVAGTVEATGSGVQHLLPGDAVYGDISEAGFGGFAEYVSVRADALVKKPSAMSFLHAAAIPHAAMLALQGLVDIGGLDTAEHVLINGAGGGVGMIGVQIAKRYGAKVTGVDSAAKLDMLRTLGFDRVLDYRSVDFTRDEPRYDLILDAKTTRPPRAYLRALAPGGRYVTVGGQVPRLLQIVSTGAIVSAFGKKRLKLLALKPNQGLEKLHEWFGPAGPRIVTDGPYRLSEVPQATQRFGDAQHIGKIIISVA